MPDWHRNDQSLPTVILIAVIVIAIAVLGVLGFQRYVSDERQEESIRKAAEEYNSSMLEARREKADLEAELAALNEQGKVTLENRGTIVFLCTEPDARVYTDIRPILEEAGFPGVVAFSEDAFPGDAGCLSPENVIELQSAGWDTVITAQKNGDIRALFDRAIKAGITPEGIYYSTPQVDESAEKTAQELGLAALFTYSSDEKAEDPSLIRVLTLGCNENGIKNVTEDSIASSKTMSLGIGFRNSRELFDETSVTNMVAFVKKQTDAGKVEVAAIDGAVSRTGEVERLLGEAQKKNEGKRRELEARIKELNMFITTGETVVSGSEPETKEAAEPEATQYETVAVIISETESPEMSAEGLTVAETETELETEPETEAAAAETVKETKPAATAKETEATTKAPETTAAKKKKKTGKTPAAPPPPEIEETPGEVYVEAPPAETKLTPKEEESGTNWPDAKYETEAPYGPGLASQ